MVLSGMGQQQQLSVLPTDDLQAMGQQFTVVLVAQAISLSLCLLSGEIWTLFMILGCLCGYWAIKNKDAYQPHVMLMFFNLNVMGNAIGFAQLAVSISKVLGPRNPLSPDAKVSAVPAMLAWAIACVVIVVTNRLAWIMYKAMLLCPMAGPGGGGGMGGPMSTQPQTTASQYHQAFQPFQGPGMRLGP